ncbi:hypothetical protein HYC85_026198 [Camellia sinensis]|uniref:Uncharacterized protein n=1 Tax=Camellia sinensis TaxID=4442 RepID=A0A7J7G307_CAMSI|nr:hypothetical protein HYC85_026198 [Camellia sinensis]
MQAGQAATSVERQGMVIVMKVPSLDGNLETGFALVLDVVCTTMLAGWNVTNAKLQGVKVVQANEIELQEIIICNSGSFMHCVTLSVFFSSLFWRSLLQFYSP